MKLYTETAAFDAALVSIANRGKKLDADIHKFAVSAALHTAVHGQPHYVNKLIEAMPKGSRVNALREWFSLFGPVEYNSDTKLFVTDKDHAKQMVAELAEGHVVPTDIETGITTPWTDLKPEGGYKPMDFTAEILKAVGKAQDRLEKAEDKGDKIDPELVAAISALIPQTVE